MSTTDCRTLHFYRLPVYQKRTAAIDNHLPSPHTRSPSPNRSVLASGRRHSTPPASSKYSVDRNSPSPNIFVKYYHSYPKPACRNKEQNPVAESMKSSPRPISFVKLRRQEEHTVRIVTTPTNVKSFTDILLPIAKKNLNTIVETTSSSLSSGIQTINNRNISPGKRGQMTSFNLEHDVLVSDKDSYNKSLQDNNSSKLKSIKWCHTKCPCRFSHCNLCHWYCSCPICCWIACFLFALALFIGLFISIRFLSSN